jgi:hypothetical protein
LAVVVLCVYLARVKYGPLIVFPDKITGMDMIYAGLVHCYTPHSP